MKSEWKEVKLGNITTKIGSGATPRGGSQVYSDVGVAFIRSQNVLDYDFRIDGLVFINDEHAKQLGNVAVHENDILLNITGDSVARACLVPKDMLPARVNQHVSIIRVNPSIADHKYILYQLQNLKDLLLSYSHSGATRKALTKSMLENLEITLPTLSEQKAISDILACLDAKIELNNKINENLEAQAQAVFKSWFIDFEPFLDGEFVDSELGLIPKGWTIGKVDDIIELHDSKRVPLSSREREGMEKVYPYYGAASLMDYVEDYIFDGTYLLLGEDGTVISDNGYPILQYAHGKFWVNNHAHVITGKNGFTVDHLFMLFSNTNVSSAVTGAVQKKINQRNLKSITVILPPQDIVKHYNRTIQPIFSLRRVLERQNQTLASIRDALLPKLMNGEIEVPVE